MANVKISELPELTAVPGDTDVIEIVSGGVSKKVSALNLKSASNSVFYPDYSATDQGDDTVDGDNNTVNYYEDTYSANNPTYVLRHNSGSTTTTYTFSTSETITGTLKVEYGAIITIATGVTLTINGKLDVLIDQYVFNCEGSGTVTGSGKIEKFSIAWTGSTGDGSTDDSAAAQKALTIAAAMNTKLYVPNNMVVYLESNISVDLNYDIADLDEITGFGIECDGNFKVDGGIDGITITNSCFGEYKLKFIDGGDESSTYCGFNLVGGYHNKLDVEAFNYRGTVLEIENGLSSGVGGNGRIQIDRLHTVNCYRALNAKPSTGSTGQNGFGVIHDWWDSNSYERSLFTSTQDVTIFQVNIDIGAVSGSQAGLFFTGCNSGRIYHIAIGEIDDALTGNEFVLTLNGGGSFYIDNLYLINESGASATTRKGIKINNMDGVSANVILRNIYNRAIEISGANSDNLNLNINAEDCVSQVLYAQSDYGGSLKLDIEAKDCGSGGSVHVVDLSQIDCENVFAKFYMNNPSATSDFLTPALHYTYIDPTSFFTASTFGIVYYPVVFTDGDTTPSIKTGRFFKTANTSATTITDFDDAIQGKEFTLIIKDANTSIDFTTAALKATGTVWAGSFDNKVDCVYDGSVWYCTIQD